MKSKELDDVKVILRRDIIFGRLRPGERLTESELATRFSVGRHIVRSAFEELEKVGLVVRKPNRGISVIEHSRQDVEDLYEMRDLLQREAIARIPMPVPRRVIGELQDYNDTYLSMLEQENLDEVVESNNRFHKTLFDLCGNRFLAQMIEDHWQRSAAIHSYAIGCPELAKTSHAEHQRMIEALQKSDRNELSRLCSLHMQPALQAYKRSHQIRPPTAD